MTVWANSVVIEDNVKNSNADAGTFYAQGNNGPASTPTQFGTYDIQDFRTNTGGGIFGGGVSIY